MFYQSMRGGQSSILSTEAIKKGIATDGGLFVPKSIVKLAMDEIGRLSEMRVKGNFDDAQNGVKAIFSDTELNNDRYFSADSQ